MFSFATDVVGVLHAAALGVHAIGRGLADAMGLDPKHAIKQSDRLLSNTGVTTARTVMRRPQPRQRSTFTSNVRRKTGNARRA